jgi:D-glycerate 3-kinase
MDTEKFLESKRLPANSRHVVERMLVPLATGIERLRRPETCRVIGICGAQGSGKSTMASALRSVLEMRGLATAVLSLDDLYLTRAERRTHAERIHPLLATRGVPGTHDVRLGMETLDALSRPGQVALPSFDKATDDRRPLDSWPLVQGPVEVVLFEGWCVGAIPQDRAALEVAVNALERERDPDGTWRRFVNDALAGEYQALFARLDALVLLKAPSFEVVYGWRLQQEHELRAATARASATRIMSDEEVATFIAHYERLTRHILEEMPSRADAVVTLSERREPVEVVVGERLRGNEGMRE